ncbi:hypothetical protein FBU30_004383 [Linnemannia zychae]|nr:hypothetical protein FBU30_004383 [Linnemannia zychae]
MSAITSSAVRMVRAAAPLRTATVRSYSSAASESATPAGLHSTKKLAIASGVSFVVGIDVTYAYFTFGQKSKPFIEDMFTHDMYPYNAKKASTMA